MKRIIKDAGGKKVFLILDIMKVHHTRKGPARAEGGPQEGHRQLPAPSAKVAHPRDPVRPA